MRLVSILFVFAACGNDRATVGTINDDDAAAREQFPDLARLYAGDAGLYRGCGPNGGVCHNGNEFPNLDSMGSIVDGIGRSCNQKRERADSLHDLCERTGDVVEINMEKIEIAAIYPDPNDTMDPPRAWLLEMRTKPTNLFRSYERLDVFRDNVIIANLRYSLDGESLLDLALDPTGRTLRMQLSPPPESGYDGGAEAAKRLAKSGIPGAADALRVGDPNRNHLFGAELGGKIIVPGDPQRSYLLRRLTDPSAGPLMPRANCCFWSKLALRALWCWVASLDETGSNAFAPINYDACPASPTVLLGYPELGDGCETAGLCPPLALGGTNEPTFPSIYAEIFVPKCSGEGCHDRAPYGGEVNFSDQETAYDTLSTKVAPGDPDASTLARRLEPATCIAPDCRVMPLDRPQLLAGDIARIRQWISDGAPRD